MAVGEGRARASGNEAHDLQCLLKYFEFVVKHAGIHIDVKHAGVQKPKANRCKTCNMQYEHM